MAEPKSIEATNEDDYDESEDSDFHGDAAEDDLSSSEDDEAAHDENSRPTKRRKIIRTANTQNDDLGELDSGDEATLRERAKAKRKAKKAGDLTASVLSDEEGDEGWRAKTRAMHEKEKDEKKRSKLASAKGSTIDVDRLWEEMNKPGAHIGGIVDPKKAAEDAEAEVQEHTPKEDASKPLEEMITIKRTYKFAGEVHTEEKTVPKSSAEARLWLAQQAARGKKAAAESNTTNTTTDAQLVRRPLRRISRFDPNFNNPDAFKKTWSKASTDGTEQKGPKLNVVEKSKMDWAAHVDTEGLKEELDLHSKAKEGYLSRMDFLNEVEAKRDEEARQARLKG